MIRVLMSCASFRAEYGGPAESVPQLAYALAALGIDVSLWAPDGSATSAEAALCGDRVKLLSGRLSQVIYSSGSMDIIHDNGIWLPHNHAIARAARKLNIPRIVAPRGMLEPWSLSHRSIRKRIAWSLYQQADLKSAAILHCTAASEARSIAALKLNVECVIVPNGVAVPVESGVSAASSLEQSKKLTVHGKERIRRMVYLSRLHPKKGILMLLEAWAIASLQNWELHIAGIPENGYDRVVIENIKRLKLSSSVKYFGPLYGREKSQFMGSADVFVLPTHSENFGMVVALSLGTPVLTTTGAPWGLLEVESCGWRVEPSVSGILEGLLKSTSVSDEHRSAMGNRGRQIIHEQFEWRAIGTSMVIAYEKLLSR